MITLIFAHDDAGGIGFNNELPWPRISEDMKHFRTSTTGKPVVMGRKTFDSLGRKALPNRQNVVISRTKPLAGDYPEDVLVTDRLDDALSFLSEVGREVFVIGGAEIYQLTFPYATRMLITRVIGTFAADTFFKPDLKDWDLVSSRGHSQDGKLICVFEEHRRIAE